MTDATDSIERRDPDALGVGVGPHGSRRRSDQGPAASRPAIALVDAWHIEDPNPALRPSDSQSGISLINIDARRRYEEQGSHLILSITVGEAYFPNLDDIVNSLRTSGVDAPVRCQVETFPGAPRAV